MLLVFHDIETYHIVAHRGKTVNRFDSCIVVGCVHCVSIAVLALRGDGRGVLLRLREEDRTFVRRPTELLHDGHEQFRMAVDERAGGEIRVVQAGCHQFDILAVGQVDVLAVFVHVGRFVRREITRIHLAGCAIPERVNIDVCCKSTTLIWIIKILGKKKATSRIASR